MQISDLTLKHNKDLVTIEPTAAISKVAAVLDGHNIGALPVCSPSGDLVGIISERDVVRGLSESGHDVHDLTVGDLMTADVITCTLGDDVNDIMGVMDERRIRHIPVVEGNRLSAIISSRDVMGALLEETKTHCETLGLAYEMVR